MGGGLNMFRHGWVHKHWGWLKGQLHPTALHLGHQVLKALCHLLKGLLMMTQHSFLVCQVLEGCVEAGCLFCVDGGQFILSQVWFWHGHEC